MYQVPIQNKDGTPELVNCDVVSSIKIALPSIIFKSLNRSAEKICLQHSYFKAAHAPLKVFI